VNVAVIGIVGLPSNYGGFETLVDQLCRAGFSKQHKVTVFCSSHKRSSTIKMPEYFDAKLNYLPIPANGSLSVLYDVLSILLSIGRCQSLLVLGVSAGLFLPFFRLFFRRIVVNIDGLEWKRQKWGLLAKWFLRLSEWVAIRASDVVIADNQAILEYVNQVHSGVNVKLIEYGGDHVARLKPAFSRGFDFKLPEKYACAVCRIEPENNIHLILNGFVGSGVPLVMVGNWDSSEYGMSLKRRYEVLDGFHLFNPIYDLDVLNRIRGGSQLYVHGHSAGGTNPSLVEAMRYELDILAYDVIYNRYTTEGYAAFFRDATEIKSFLVGFQSSSYFPRKPPESLLERYSWRRICRMYSELFD